MTVGHCFRNVLVAQPGDGHGVLARALRADSESLAHYEPFRVVHRVVGGVPYWHAGCDSGLATPGVLYNIPGGII
jgi:hypothetical protein